MVVPEICVYIPITSAVGKIAGEKRKYRCVRLLHVAINLTKLLYFE